ncbi:hypothetical protein FOA52_013800 [Chlamydomonas sp. UWO 241]|nr:hypothetical protein FOA52_013800 [Chlamydomonas sp. UWO 241]
MDDSPGSCLAGAAAAAAATAAAMARRVPPQRVLRSLRSLRIAAALGLLLLLLVYGWYDSKKRSSQEAALHWAAFDVGQILQTEAAQEVHLRADAADVARRAAANATAVPPIMASSDVVCPALEAPPWGGQGAGARAARRLEGGHNSGAGRLARVRARVLEFMSDPANGYAGGDGSLSSGAAQRGLAAARAAVRAAFPQGTHSTWSSGGGGSGWGNGDSGSGSSGGGSSGSNGGSGSSGSGSSVNRRSGSGGGGGGGSSGGGSSSDISGSGGADARALASALATVAHVLRSSGRLMQCEPDDALVRAAASAARAPGAGRILVAMNLYNSGDMAPNMVAQLLTLIAMLPHGSVSISIYESGSSDSIGWWLQLLQVLLCPLRVPFRITTHGNLSRGRDDATEREVDRIEFLAKVRNEAMLPLLMGQLGGSSSSSSGAGGQGAAGAAAPVAAAGAARAAGAAAAPLRERLVFINDVFFCARDVLRLVMHDQDLACGIDLSTEGQFGAHDRSLSFYDSWVARDASGAMITGKFPDMADAAGSARARAGLPVPVYCCWNGMAAISTEPLRRGLRFRAAMPGECRASECSLLCDDLHRLGFGRVVIDPNVITTYRPHHAQAARLQPRTYDPRQQISQTSWTQVAASGPIPPARANLSGVVCCSKDEGSDGIDWSACGPRDVAHPNHTDAFLRGELRRLETGFSVGGAVGGVEAGDWR